MYCTPQYTCPEPEILKDAVPDLRPFILPYDVSNCGNINMSSTKLMNTSVTGISIMSFTSSYLNVGCKKYCYELSSTSFPGYTKGGELVF